MKNKILILIIGLSLIGVAFAGGILYEKVSIDLSQQQGKQITSEKITFNCDGKSMEVTGTESDGKYDEQDLRSLALNNGCSGVMTNIQNSKGEYFESVGSIKSFDTTEKKIEECRISGMRYDGESRGCERIIDCG